MNTRAKAVIKSVKNFSILFVGTCVWLTVLMFPLIYLSDKSEIGMIIYVCVFFILSIIGYVYFSKRSKLVGDKSHTAVMFALKEDIKSFFIQVKNFFIALFKIVKVLAVIALIIWGISALFGGNDDVASDAYQKGDMSNSGGSPTYRYDDTPSYYDDYSTSNDESNDQASGFYGTDTMYACNGNSGNCYDLDVDSDGENIERIYFPKGGWVDVDSSDCDEGYCVVEDENGTEWELEY